MSDNVLQTLQQLIQDVIAPDVRELKVRVSSLEKQMDVRFDAMDQKFKAMDEKFKAMDEKMDTRFKAMDEKMDARFDSLLSAIRESRAQAELTNVRVIASLSDVAVLESQRH